MSRRPSLTLVLALALTPALQADGYLVYLQNPLDLTGVRARSSEIVKRLKAHYSSNMTALAPQLRALALPEAELTPLWVTNGFHVSCDVAMASRLARLDGVERVQPVELVPLSPVRTHEGLPAPESDITWSVERVGAPSAWTKGYDGTGVVVGHIDTGVDGNHPDLKGKILRFRDFVTGSNGRPIDEDGHGTHTAGTIAGGAAGGTAIGVAPGARLIVARVLTSQGSNTFRLIRAMQWMLNPDGNDDTDDAPSICSNSWGSTLRVDPSFWLTVNSWRAAGMVPVFAAGNEGPNPKTIGIPGGYPHALTVGATNKQDGMASFSSRGPVRWLFKTYVKPDVSAPGSYVYSARNGGGYTYLSGTSMATPAVAGTLALLKQRYPWMNVEQLEDRIEKKARDKGPAGKDNDYGFGIADVTHALGSE